MVAKYISVVGLEKFYTCIDINIDYRLYVERNINFWHGVYSNFLNGLCFLVPNT